MRWSLGTALALAVAAVGLAPTPGNCQDHMVDFTFVRLKWTPRGDLPPGGWDIHKWDVDYTGTDGPGKAEECLMNALKLSTRFIKSTKTRVLEVGSVDLSHHPFAYMAEVGWIDFSAQEALNLGNWLNKGGFLVVDDFHGTMDEFDGKSKPLPNQWRQWIQALRKVFPNLIEDYRDHNDATVRTYFSGHRRGGDPVILRLRADHPIFHQRFSFSEVPHIKGLAAGDGKFEFGGTEHYVMGLFDWRGRMMAVMNYNMDIGDGWEFCAEPWKQDYSEGLRLGINYIFYSFTH